MIFPDSLGSRGLGPACGRPDHPAAAAGVRLGDALAALLWATRQAEEPAGGAFLLGWSHGGSTVLWAVAHPLPPGILRAAIAFYPSCLPLLRAAPSWVSTVPLLILVGEADDWTPPAACLALAAHGGETVSLQLFAEARHGFDHPEAAVRLRLLPNGQWVSSGTNPAARAAAIAAVLHFLARH